MFGTSTLVDENKCFKLLKQLLKVFLQFTEYTQSIENVKVLKLYLSDFTG